MTSRRRMLGSLAALGITGLPALGWTQERYPARPIRMIVPHPAGGGVDIIARLIGEPMRVTFGQPIVVENRPGANGMIGAQLAATSAPDGYTLLMSGPGEIVISPHLYKSMAYDPF